MMMMSEVKQDDVKEMDYIDFDGHRRYLASRPSNGKMKLMLPNYEDSGMPMFDKKDWRPVNRRKIFTPEIIFDQNGHGSCFPAGTRIRMADGSEKNIEQIRLLDSVLTAEGNIGKVSHLFVREDAKRIYRISIWGHNHLRLTGEHPILTKKGYIKAKKLKIGDVVAFPRYMPESSQIIVTANHIHPGRFMLNRNGARRFAGVVGRKEVVVKLTAVPDVIKMTPGFGRLGGLFLAEGNTDTNKMTFSFHINEKDTLAADAIRLFKEELDVEAHYKELPHHNSCKVIVYGKLWAQLFESLFSNGSSSKKLHPVISSGPKDFLKALLDAWMQGDGHKKHKNYRQGVTVSKDLALNMYDIAQALGRRPVIRLSHPFPSHGVKVRQDRWDVCYQKKPRSSQYCKQSEKYVWRKVKGIDVESFKGPVYNFEVRGDNSYVAEGIGVHNCVANGWVGALMRSRVLRGYKLIKLSPGFFYSLINGGSDNGAVISDGIKAGQGVGSCLFSTVGQNPIYTRQMPATARAEAQRFRVGRAFHCANWQQAVSAVQANLIIVYGYMVGNRFGKIDKDGFGGHDNGPGNHCNHADGFVILPSGRMGLDDVNSWATSFGDQGRVLLDEEHLFGGGDQADVCAIESIEEDPQEEQPPAFVP